MKFLAAEIASSFSPIGVSLLKKCNAAPTNNALRNELRNLEQGGIWTQLGITNFLEGDLFSWYLDAWDDTLAETIRVLVGSLDQYDPTTLSVEPAESRDLLKKLYHRLFPRSVRHDLGEYYTPDWLAEFTLDELEYDGNPDKRLLDPACGSGTFLVMAINRVKAWFDQNRDQCGFGETELIQKILTNIIGFDLNPLAVMASRTNYLIALRDLLKSAPAVELPVYLCDTIMTPAEYSDLFAGGELGKIRKLRTAGGVFNIPAEIAAPRETLGRYTDLLEQCIRNGYKPNEFVARCEDNGLPVEEAELHCTLYSQLQTLHADNKNGIWARIIKNAFAPLFIGQVDYVAGNPPWVNWEHLPGEYRDDTKTLWQHYGLFTLSGSAGRLGGGKKDLSMLFVYGATDCYLKEGGRLGYVITQTLFKTKGAGDGFRQFRFPKGNTTVVIKPLRVNDLGNMQVFDGATNRAAVFLAEKRLILDKSQAREAIGYPVPYILWRGPGRVPQEIELNDLKQKASRSELGAVPVEPGKPNSPWLTAPAAALLGISKVIGKSNYVAHAGVYSGGLNGCFWVRILDRLPNGNLLIENLHDVGKIKVESVQTSIEPDLVYPLIRGYGVHRWRTEPNAYIILAQNPQTRTGIPLADMKRKYPETYAYLKRFEEQLLQRASSSVQKLMEDGKFYSMFAVGAYTLAPIRVFWRQFLPDLRMTVYAQTHHDIVGAKVALTQHVVSFAAFDTIEEAHYFAACGNSGPVQLLHWNSSTSKSYGTPSILDIIGIPRYQSDDSRHRALAALSEQCHIAAAAGDAETIAALEPQIDKIAAELWNIIPEELLAIHAALAEMKTSRPLAAQEDNDDDTPQLEIEE